MAQQISQDDYLNDTSQFDLARKKAADQSTVDLQNRKDALARRFASLGNLDSGVRLKQEANAATDASHSLQNANEGINAQQQAEIGRRKEVVQGQQFQSGEAQKGRDFSSDQANLQRNYGTSERVAGQQFSGEQAAMQRAYLTGERESGQKYATGERLGTQGFQSGEADKQRAQQEDQFLKTYGLSVNQYHTAMDQFDQTYKEEVRVDNKNIDFAQQALNKKGMMDQLTSNPANMFAPGFKQAGTSIKNTVSSWF